MIATAAGVTPGTPHRLAESVVGRTEVSRSTISRDEPRHAPDTRTLPESRDAPDRVRAPVARRGA